MVLGTGPYIPHFRMSVSVSGQSQYSPKQNPMLAIHMKAHSYAEATGFASCLVFSSGVLWM